MMIKERGSNGGYCRESHTSTCISEDMGLFVLFCFLFLLLFLFLGFGGTVLGNFFVDLFLFVLFWSTLVQMKRHYGRY